MGRPGVRPHRPGGLLRGPAARRPQRGGHRHPGRRHRHHLGARVRGHPPGRRVARVRPPPAGHLRLTWTSRWWPTASTRCPPPLTVSTAGGSDHLALPAIADGRVAGSVVDVPRRPSRSLTGADVRITFDTVRLEDTVELLLRGPRSPCPSASPRSASPPGGPSAARSRPTIPATCTDTLLAVDGAPIWVAGLGDHGRRPGPRRPRPSPSAVPTPAAWPSGRGTTPWPRPPARSAASTSTSWPWTRRPAAAPCPGRLHRRQLPAPPGRRHPAGHRRPARRPPRSTSTVDGVATRRDHPVRPGPGPEHQRRLEGHRRRGPRLGPPILVDGFANGWRVDPAALARAVHGGRPVGDAGVDPAATGRRGPDRLGAGHRRLPGPGLPPPPAATAAPAARLAARAPGAVGGTPLAGPAGDGHRRRTCPVAVHADDRPCWPCRSAPRARGTVLVAVAVGRGHRGRGGRRRLAPAPAWWWGWPPRWSCWCPGLLSSSGWRPSGCVAAGGVYVVVEQAPATAPASGDLAASLRPAGDWRGPGWCSWAPTPRSRSSAGGGPAVRRPDRTGDPRPTRDGSGRRTPGGARRRPGAGPRGGEPRRARRRTADPGARLPIPTAAGPAGRPGPEPATPAPAGRSRSVPTGSARRRARASAARAASAPRAVASQVKRAACSRAPMPSRLRSTSSRSDGVERAAPARRRSSTRSPDRPSTHGVLGGR